MPVFLFTGIEDSTSLWEKHRPVMLRMLRQHNALMDESLAMFGGRLIKYTGDLDLANLPESAVVHDFGEQQLKGVAEPQIILSLLHHDLPF